MIGTAISAIVLGPWWGALVGTLTNVGSSLITGPTALPFFIVNVVGALLWGYGVRSWKLGRTIPRFFLLNIIVAVACKTVAAPIIVFVFGGATGNGADALTGTFLAIGQNLVGSVFSSNILTSLADKIIGGFVALAIIEALPKSLTANVEIVRNAFEGHPSRGRRYRDRGPHRRRLLRHQEVIARQYQSVPSGTMPFQPKNSGWCESLSGHTISRPSNPASKETHARAHHPIRGC